MTGCAACGVRAVSDKVRSPRRYWGKARPAAGARSMFHLLPHHCIDVAAVGVEAMRRIPVIPKLLQQRLGLEQHESESWLAFWLALHDLGKFAESFQGQCPDVFVALRGRQPNPAKPYTLRHDSVGMLFWKEVLRDRMIVDRWFGPNSEDLAEGLDWWVRAVTGHHGQPPEEIGYWADHFDTGEDRRAALEFIDDARTLFLDDALIARIAASDPQRFLSASLELSWWIAGLAVFADWLGSSTDHFPYSDEAIPLAKYWPRARAQAIPALDASGVSHDRSSAPRPFAVLFPGINSPSPLQRWAAGVVVSSAPQIHLLEDVTGAGKTEAAILLAHRLMAAGAADGFFIGLPTMATANAMYGRIANVYAALFTGQASLVLTHGQRDLVEAFADSVLPRGVVEGDGRQLDETATARCAAWLADHNKRALLAPAGVGTLDQALLAVLHSKHQSLRLLGLLRKVLVVDEVHACDSYMQGVLEVLLEFHARAGGSAILMSATLPQRMKAALLAAFARGASERAPTPDATAYPLTTSWSSRRPQTVHQQAIRTRSDMQRRVHVRCTGDADEVRAAILDALRLGQCVCWVRNTVADARSAFEQFRGSVATDSLMLFHARFALRDRLDMEARVLACFGASSGPSQRAGRLLIATQVVEQSLDVDFDLVVSDLAPIDRMVQRSGRLRRHPRDLRGARLPPTASDQRGEPWLWVLTPPWTDEPAGSWYKAAFPKAAAVYPHHGQLWLTARSLRGGSFTMPDDARSLIEGVFSANAELPAGLDANASAAEGAGFAAASQAQMNTVKLAHGYQRGGIDWWSEAKTPSRLGEESTTVVLARWDGNALHPWVDGLHGWDYSSLRVAERLIAEVDAPADPARRRAIDATRADMPGQGRWSILLPLESTAQGWVGYALSAPQRKQPPRRLAWIYDKLTGLRQLDNDAPANREDPEA